MDTELTEGTRDRINWAGEGWFRLRLRVDPDVPKTDVWACSTDIMAPWPSISMVC